MRAVLYNTKHAEAARHTDLLPPASRTCSCGTDKVMIKGVLFKCPISYREVVDSIEFITDLVVRDACWVVWRAPPASCTAGCVGCLARPRPPLSRGDHRFLVDEVY
jgi:hypothetical protein